jgi:transcriptional regulator with XRE-family HTH domain
MTRERGRLFSALLKYWRQRRGLSQLDLALASDVSARHLSFLETGRAQPSREMVLRLGAALDVPLRDQNALLDAAGLLEAFPEPALLDGIPAAVRMAIDRMAEQQEPFPLLVMNRVHDVLIANRAAVAFATRFVKEPSRLAGPMNTIRLLFDPELSRPFIVEWERVARSMLAILYREVLTHPEDARLRTLFSEIQEFPDMPLGFREPDLSTPSEPTFTLRLERDGLELGFLTTLTAFTAPQNVTLEELRIESFFPLDEATAAACTNLASAGTP